MRSSVDIQFSVCLIRIIPEPSFPSQGSQAQGTRLGGISTLAPCLRPERRSAPLARGQYGKNRTMINKTAPFGI